MVSYDYTATSNSTHVVLGPPWMDGDPNPGGDDNPVINALTVQQLPGNTVGYWRLDDGTPGTAATTVDSLFNNGALQGTANGSPVFNADRPAGTIVDGLNGPEIGPSTASLEFSNSQSVFIPFDPLLEPDQFTVEFFMKADAQGGYPGIVQKRKQLGGSSTVGGGNITWGVGKEANERTFARVDTTTTTNRTWTILGSTADGEWHHFALTYEEVANNGVWTLYRDYELLAVKTDVGLIDYDGMSGLYFGDATSTDFQQYLGLLDEVRFSDVVLTPEQFLHAIPEPASIALLALGCLMVPLLGRRRRFTR